MGRWLSRDSIQEAGAATLQLPFLLTREAEVADMRQLPDQIQIVGSVYGFVDNNPITRWDILGRRIYLQRGNNSGRPGQDAIHLGVCVDVHSIDSDCDELVTKRCFSFGLDYEHPWGWSWPSLYWLGWPVLRPAGFMKGVIYEMDYTGGVKNLAIWESTLDQDKTWLKYMEGRVDVTRDLYRPFDFNCVQYSLLEFADAPRHWTQ